MAAAYSIAGWLIIQISTSVFPAFNFPDWTTQFVIILVFLGLPISLIIAWAFELTPDGLKKTEEVNTETSITPQTGKKLNMVIITVLSMALIFVLVERVFFARSGIVDVPGTEIHAASIAVLPFVNMSSDEENEYFSDGLSEELLNGLAKIEGMQVAGRTSSFQFKGQTPDFKEVGELLKVQHVLEGSVRKSGNRIRITAQLIQADNGYHLWSETYDRELTATDIFDIQEEITRKVVSELKVRLLPEEEIAISENPTQDIEAYNAFLEATQVEASRQPDDMAHAIKKYKEAISIDPTFSLAYARMAYTYKLMNSYGNLSFDESKKLVRDNIDQALLLNSNEGRAYQALALYFDTYESDYVKAEEAARKAVKLLQGDAMVYNTLFNALTDSEKFDEADQMIQRAYELDPLNNIVATNYSTYLWREGRYDQSITILDKIIDRYPDYSQAIQSKSSILSTIPYGELGEAFKLVYKAYQTNPKDRALLETLRARARDLDMFKLADHYEVKLKELYPENTVVQFYELERYLEEKEYDKAEAFLEEYKKKVGDESGEVTRYMFSTVYGFQGRYDEAIDLYTRFDKELAEKPNGIDQNNSGRVVFIGFLYLEAGRDEEVKKYADAVCSFLEGDLENKPENMPEFQLCVLELNCTILKQDYVAMTEELEEWYFDRNFKSGYTARDGNIGFGIPEEIKEMPELKEVMDRVYDDIHEMRSDVIDYLKAEGEWKEEWAEDNPE